MLRFETKKDFKAYINYLKKKGVGKSEINEVKRRCYVKPKVKQPPKRQKKPSRVLHALKVYSYLTFRMVVLDNAENGIRRLLHMKKVKRDYVLKDIERTKPIEKPIEKEDVLVEKPKTSYEVKGNYPLDVFENYQSSSETINHKAVYQTINDTLERYGIKEAVTDHRETSRSSVYYITIQGKTRVKDFERTKQEIALALGLNTVHIGTFKGKLTITIPKKEKAIMSLKKALQQATQNHLKIPIGFDYEDNAIYELLDDIKHLLIGGSSDSGKTSLLYQLIASLIYFNTPDRVKFYMVDFKRHSLPRFDSIPHMISPTATTPEELEPLLDEVECEMNRRNAIEFPRIVVIIDELEDIRYHNKLWVKLNDLIRKGRSAGIYFWVATQSPYNEIIPADFKNNLLTRIALKVKESGVSETILGVGHTEAFDLMGKGDLILNINNDYLRLQAPYVSEKELSNIIRHVATPEEVEINGETIKVKPNSVDDEFIEFCLLGVKEGGVSVNMFRQNIRNNYTRAKNVITLMQEYGICDTKLNEDNRYTMFMTEDEIQSKFSKKGD